MRSLEYFAFMRHDFHSHILLTFLVQNNTDLIALLQSVPHAEFFTTIFYIVDPGVLKSVTSRKDHHHFFRLETLSCIFGRGTVPKHCGETILRTNFIKKRINKNFNGPAWLLCSGTRNFPRRAWSIMDHGSIWVVNPRPTWWLTWVTLDYRRVLTYGLTVLKTWTRCTVDISILRVMGHQSFSVIHCHL